MPMRLFFAMILVSHAQMSLAQHAGSLITSESAYGYAIPLLANDPMIQPHLGMEAGQLEFARQDLQSYLTNEIERLTSKPEAIDSGVPEDAESDAVVAHEFFDALTPSQRERLAQIAFQMVGIDAFHLPAMIGELRLTPTEAENVRPLIRAYAARYKAWSERSKADGSISDEESKEMGLIEREAVASALKVIGEASASRYRHLSGEPVDFTRWQLKTSWRLSDAALPEASGKR